MKAGWMADNWDDSMVVMWAALSVASMVAQMAALKDDSMAVQKAA